ncbi:DUF6916 family protein [Dyella flagellata]|uniref:DUF6916 domain-containing protein n=1 Tax=Dyella flagellata TaxID=1867833 RepID=A0ABQ5X706_9GAMM|nr:hypothetical protein [Dyella flagellata]GLQ86464.1 hypothetical protein GCM10007898_00300 [Dyella flagellata]
MRFLSAEDFAPHLNETFHVDMGESRTPFMLVEIKPLATPMLPGMVRAPFSLVFHNGAAIVFPQKIYPMHHDSLGEFGIFLVAVARNRDGFLYQAVFN